MLLKLCFRSKYGIDAKPPLSSVATKVNAGALADYAALIKTDKPGGGVSVVILMLVLTVGRTSPCGTTAWHVRVSFIVSGNTGSPSP